jgi:hypothetical protein
VNESCFKLKEERIFLRRDEEIRFFEVLSERLDKRISYIETTRRPQKKEEPLRKNPLLVKYS